MKKKLGILIISLVSIFVIFLYMYFHSHDYSIEYEINDVTVKENFIKSKGIYKFIFSYDDVNFEVIAKNKYSNKRRLVTDINLTNDDNNLCLDFKSNHVNLYPLCFDGKKYYTKYIDDVSFVANNSYENIKINELMDKTYLLWDYHNFIYLNSQKQDKISLFNKDIYNLNLIYQDENYLYVPDYEQNYMFDKMYYINKANGKVKDINLRYEVYFDSYFLGHEKNKVYLYDIKSEQEYYINVKEEKIYKFGNKILNNNKWENVSNQKLKNDRLSFINDVYFIYTLEDNKLYGKAIDSEIKFLISNNNVTKVVKTEGLDVYYLVKDILYYFNPTIGTKPLLKYSEWEFNNENMIFVF